MVRTLILFGVVLATTVAPASSSVGAKHRPIAFTQPTSIWLEPAGTLLLVENNPGRVLRVDPRSGHVTALVASIGRPYAVVRTSSGRVFFSAGSTLRRLDRGGKSTVVARADSDIGPIAAAPDGTIYYATGDKLYRLPAGSTAPSVIPTAGLFASPHGLAVAADGAVLLSDTGHNRIVRIDPGSASVKVLAHVTSPRGLDVAADGSLYAVDSGANRVLHLTASGTRIAYLARAAGDLYDVQAGRGAVYVLEAGGTGWVRRIARNGTVTTL